jgi:predicted MPP superfamily phosphohydrolase
MSVSAIVCLAMAIGIAVGFVHKLPVRREAKIAAHAVVAALFLMCVTYMPLRRYGYFGGYLEDIFASSVAVLFVSFIAVLIGDWIARALKNPRHKHIVRLSTPIVAAAYLGYGFFSAFTAPNINRAEVEIEGLSANIAIAHLSDLHLGNGKLLNERFAKNIVDQVNALKPDLIVIAGDLTDAPIERIEAPLREIAKLRAKYGVFYAAGNHEYIYNPDEVFSRLEQLGIVVLRNDSRIIRLDEGELAIAGTYDLSGRRRGRLTPDPVKAMANVPTDTPTIALFHQPKLAFEFPPNSFDLAFAGHTHGGQMFPFTIFVSFIQPYFAGLYDHDERGKIYVSRGVGYWGPPFRMFAPNEIALITLKPKEHK